MKYLQLLIALLLVATGVRDAAAADGDIAGVPETIDYQGSVTDKDLKPLGTAANGDALPTNYTVQFRIYANVSGGAPLWSESQVVTISKGQFSVRLGEGTAIGDVSSPIALKRVFEGTARYLGVTVLPAGSTTAGEISPRLAFLAAPFAMVADRAKLADVASLATKATLASAVSQASNASSTLGITQMAAATVATTMLVTGDVTANKFLGIGSSLTALDASKITLGQLSDDRLSAKVVKTDRDHTMSGINKFTNTQNVFLGDGRGLSIDSTKLVNTIPDSLLPTNVVRGAMHDQPLLLREPSDGYHGLLYGRSAQQINVSGGLAPINIGLLFSVDGPVLVGNEGGELGNIYLKDGYVTGDVSLKWQRAGVEMFHPAYFYDALIIHKGNSQVTWRFSQEDNGTPSEGDAGKGSELRLSYYDGDYDRNAHGNAERGYFYFYKGVMHTTSDRRLKKDISALPPALESVLKLQPVTYRMNMSSATSSKNVGFVAQDVQPIFPQTVSEHDGMLALSYSDFGVYAIKAVQELTAESRQEAATANAEIQKLQSENSALRQDLGNLQQRLEALEARLK